MKAIVNRVVYNQWTGLLEWITGLAYFWFLHIFGWFTLTSERASRNLYPNELRIKAIFLEFSNLFYRINFAFPYCCTSTAERRM